MTVNGVGFSLLFFVCKAVHDIELSFDALMYGASRSALLAWLMSNAFSSYHGRGEVWTAVVCG